MNSSQKRLRRWIIFFRCDSVPYEWSFFSLWPIRLRCLTCLAPICPRINECGSNILSVFFFSHGKAKCTLKASERSCSQLSIRSCPYTPYGVTSQNDVPTGNMLSVFLYFLLIYLFVLLLLKPTTAWLRPTKTRIVSHSLSVEINYTKLLKKVTGTLSARDVPKQKGSPAFRRCSSLNLGQNAAQKVADCDISNDFAY